LDLHPPPGSSFSQGWALHCLQPHIPPPPFTTPFHYAIHCAPWACLYHLVSQVKALPALLGIGSAITRCAGRQYAALPSSRRAAAPHRHHQPLPAAFFISLRLSRAILTPGSTCPNISSTGSPGRWNVSWKARNSYHHLLRAQQALRHCRPSRTTYQGYATGCGHPTTALRAPSMATPQLPSLPGSCLCLDLHEPCPSLCHAGLDSPIMGFRTHRLFFILDRTSFPHRQGRDQHLGAFISCMCAGALRWPCLHAPFLWHYCVPTQTLYVCWFFGNISWRTAPYAQHLPVSLTPRTRATRTYRHCAARHGIWCGVRVNSTVLFAVLYARPHPTPTCCTFSPCFALRRLTRVWPRVTSRCNSMGPDLRAVAHAVWMNCQTAYLRHWFLGTSVNSILLDDGTAADYA